MLNHNFVQIFYPLSDLPTSALDCRLAPLPAEPAQSGVRWGTT